MLKITILLSSKKEIVHDPRCISYLQYILGLLCHFCEMLSSLLLLFMDTIVLRTGFP